MDVVVWLRTLGLGKYEAIFRENDIDETVLPSLTHENLKELGVASFGHRVKLLDAIAALRTEGSSKAPTVDAATTSTSPNAHPEDRAERRQVTVMFSDLVGSTALSARMDPEDLREVISAYQKCVAETVGRFGGFVAKYMGDGVLIYFGYPQAHEDDAERAVRAGLELVAAVSGLKTHAALQTRVGIATGLVVVGDLIGSGASQEQAIVGETPNLAARLQGIAESNSVVIAENTRKLLGDLFELEDLGAKDLKGIAGPVRVWSALRTGSAEGRFEAFHATGLTELVGREEELELLLRRWSKAKTDEGQVVLLCGEAGIGKSRLTAALLERLANEPHTRIRSFCSPQHTNSALYPIIGQLERAAGLTRDDKPQAKLDKLDAMLAQSSTSTQDAALFADMLSLPNDGRYPPLELTPQQRRQRTLVALVLQIEAISRQDPLLIIFEDAHWTDPTSLELFGRIVDKISTLRVLLIVTFRPEFEPPWIGRPLVTALMMNRLGQREIGAMIDHVTGNKPLPGSIRQDIIERTDGIPLFVEEMTKAVLEAGSESVAEHTGAAVPYPALAVPASLHASLMARLDRLGPAKEVAQIGAAIGREHPHALLALVTRKPDAELEAPLDRLVAAGLLFRQGSPPHATYLFKHALVRDVAYGSLLRDQRQQLHGRIADVLAEHFATTVEAEPEVIAHHYREAGMADAASTYFERAGDRAVARSAYIEATVHFRAAIEEADRLPQKDERGRCVLTLLLKLGPAIGWTIGEWKPEVEAVYRRARDLGREVGDGPELFRATWGLWSYVSRTDTKQSRKLTEELTTLARQLGDESLLLEAQHCRWGEEALGGDVPKILETSEEGIRRYDAKRHAQLVAAFGTHDPGVCALVVHAVGLSLRGLPDQARRTNERALLLAESLSHPPSVGFAYKMVGFCLMIAGDRHGCERIGARCVTLAEKFDLPIFRGTGRYLMGWAKAQGLTLSEGLALMEEAFPFVENTFYKFFGAALAEARFDAGRVTDALALVDHALNTGEGPASGLYVSEVHRLRGVFLKSLGFPVEEVERALHTALQIADEQGALLLKLRAAMSLARLWRDQGKPQQARELLAPVYGWFMEGFDTLDLKEAKALLEELAS
jgi:class 3 adenylate cyclase/tetratricopeptide (TPR) repeat protein